MIDDNRQLIDEVIALTGAAAPDWSDPSAPTLAAAPDSTLYLIGVIGGKDVGKSSLINAILGQPLATVSSVGQGTHRAMAFVHRDDAADLAGLLEPHIPGQFDVVTHQNDAARRRVIIDLPDIDSIWADHFELTRRLLRHLLFPVWVQSIEKYADQQPMQLLGKVSAGNSPKNFLFVLSKADVLARRHGSGAVDELKADYAARIKTACALDDPPTVFAVNGQPDAAETFDLQAFTQTILAERTERAVTDARQLARAQQQRSLKQWLMQQQVDERLAGAQRLLAQAQANIDARLTEPLVERATLQLDASAAGQTIVEPVVSRRLSYWPIVNVLDAVLGPVVAAFRPRGTVWASESLAGRTIADQVRGVFAELAHANPQVLELYAHNKLWENDSASITAGRLERQIDLAIEHHRAILIKAAGKPTWPTRLLAPLVTLGAALWFPIVQPVLEIVLSANLSDFSRQTILLIVQLLGATYLIRSVGMLAIYFVALWLLLRWLAYRQVERALRRNSDATHPTAAVIAWSEGLLAPIRKHVERLQILSARIAELGASARVAS